VERLTTDKTATPLWVAPLGHVTFDILANYSAVGEPKVPSEYTRNHRRFDTVVGFRPTGWTHTQQGRGIGNQLTSSSSVLSVRSRRVETSRLLVVGAPYSEHSSFPELVDAVESLHAKRIVPTVNCHSEVAVKSQLDLLLPNRGSDRLLKVSRA